MGQDTKCCLFYSKKPVYGHSQSTLKLKKYCFTYTITISMLSLEDGPSIHVTYVTGWGISVKDLDNFHDVILYVRFANIHLMMVMFTPSYMSSKTGREVTPMDFTQLPHIFRLCASMNILRIDRGFCCFFQGDFNEMFSL